MKKTVLLIIIALSGVLRAGDTVVVHSGFDSLRIPREALRDFRLSQEEKQVWLSELPHTLRGENYSFQFSLSNPSADSLEIFLGLPLNNFWLLRQARTGRFLQTGRKVDLDERQLRNESNVLRLVLPPGETETYQMLTGSFVGLASYTYPIELLSPKVYYKDFQQQVLKHRNALALDYFFMGALSLMMLYMLFLYFQNSRNPMFLFYAIYMLCALLYMGPKMFSGSFWSELFSENRLFYTYTNEPIQIALFLCYNLFVAEFLNLRERSPRLWHTFMGVSVIYTAYFLFVVFYQALTGEIAWVQDLFFASRLGFFLFGLYLLGDVLVTYKNPIKWYILIGSMFFTAGSLLAMYYSINVGAIDDWGIYALSFMKLGILFEILFFSLGIGRKIRSLGLQKDKMQEAYIRELKRNEELNRENQVKLEKEVEERTAEILQTTHELEMVRAEKLKAQYEQELIQSQMSSLRLQMNPHFIFNSLNSIRHLILKKDLKQASSYVTEFARLLRLILQNSKQNMVPLADDLDALKLYLNFEQRRFEQKFDYEIEIDEQVSLESTEVQPLLIQPFVENAIWHGLMHRNSPGRVRLHISSLEEGIQAIIEDNGVGRAKSREINSQRGKHKSYGLSITKERLELMNRIKQSQRSYKVEDLYDENGAAAGTRVTLTLKN